MRIVFFGATRIGYKCLQILAEKTIGEVVGVFTLPKEFQTSYSLKPVNNVLYEDFRPLCKKLNLPVFEVQDNINSYLKYLKDLQPDLIFVVGWYYMIPQSFRELASLGCVGIHNSLLPKYRGGAPLVWAIINGEKETGVTLFYMNDEVDAGDLIAQQRIYIENNDSIREILAKCERVSIRLVEEFIPKIRNGTAPRITQNHQESTVMPQRKPEDGQIDWSWSPEKIKNFIRAQTKPYFGAFTFINKKKVILWDADVFD